MKKFNRTQTIKQKIKKKKMLGKETIEENNSWRYRCEFTLQCQKTRTIRNFSVKQCFKHRRSQNVSSEYFKNNNNKSKNISHSP